MGEVVRFDKKQLAVMQHVVDREKEKEVQLTEAYEWAVERQREYGFMARPVHIDFKTGDHLEDVDGFTVAVFYKKATKEALLLRYWEKRMAISYNILTNFDKLAMVAPKSLERMLQNGLELKKRWEEADYI